MAVICAGRHILCGYTQLLSSLQKIVIQLMCLVLYYTLSSITYKYLTCALIFQNAFYEKIYGKCLANESADISGTNLLIECPEILLAREKQEANNKKEKENSIRDDIQITPSAADKPQVTYELLYMYCFIYCIVLRHIP